MKEITILGSKEIRETLAKAGMQPQNVICGGSTYELFSEDDVQSKLASVFTQFLIDAEFTYEPGRLECRMFARAAVFFADLLHSKQKTNRDNARLFGVLELPTKGDEACVAIHQSDAEVLYPVAYLPQRDERGVALSPMTLTLQDWEHATARF